MLGGFADDDEGTAAVNNGDDASPTPNMRADDGRVSFGIGDGDDTALDLLPLLSVASLL